MGTYALRVDLLSRQFPENCSGIHTVGALAPWVDAKPTSIHSRKRSFQSCPVDVCCESPLANLGDGERGQSATELGEIEPGRGAGGLLGFQRSQNIPASTRRKRSQD